MVKKLLGIRSSGPQRERRHNKIAPIEARTPFSATNPSNSSTPIQITKRPMAPPPQPPIAKGGLRVAKNATNVTNSATRPMAVRATTKAHTLRLQPPGIDMAGSIVDGIIDSQER
jgi:hypothetical protein